MKKKKTPGKPSFAPTESKPMMAREVAFMPETAAPEVAKLFWNGRSQAVRLPKEFRFEGDAVRIRRRGDAVILEPIRERPGWPAGFWEDLDASPKDWLDLVVRSKSETAMPPLVLPGDE